MIIKSARIGSGKKICKRTFVGKNNWKLELSHDVLLEFVAWIDVNYRKDHPVKLWNGLMKIFKDVIQRLVIDHVIIIEAIGFI